MKIEISDEIKKIEKRFGRLSSVQKILLVTDGSVTRILDVLKGNVKIKTLIQQFQEADHDVASELDIEQGDTVNYRVVVIGTNKPLIHAVSFIPVDRLDNDFKEDLIRADIPIGRILKKYNIEARREIEHIGVEKPSEELLKIFNTNSLMLTRTYNIIHKNKVLIRIKETFPQILFKNSSI